MADRSSGGPRSVGLAVGRALGDPSLTARAHRLAAWAEANPAGPRAAALLEAFVEA